MKNLTLAAILAATVMVAGAFAFIPVENASAVHTSTQGANSIRSVSSIVAEADLVIGANKAFPTADVHNQVTDGYIIINTSVPNVDVSGTPLTNLKCATWDDTGAEKGTASVVTALGSEFTDGNKKTYHCHIPSDSATILVGLTADSAVTIPAHAVITTTIDSIQ